MDDKIQKSVRARRPVWTPLIVMLSVAAYAVPELSSAFVYDRDLILNGQVWRLWSGHIVHFNGIHLSYNLLVFGVTGWIIETRGYRYFGLLCAMVPFFIGTVLIVVKPAMMLYGGLSGLACSAVYYLTLLGLREPKPWRTVSLMILLMVTLKIMSEFYLNDSILPYPGRAPFVAIPLSHVIGGLSAFLLFITIHGGKLLSRSRLTEPGAFAFKKTNERFIRSTRFIGK